LCSDLDGTVHHKFTQEGQQIVKLILMKGTWRMFILSYMQRKCNCTNCTVVVPTYSAFPRICPLPPFLSPKFNFLLHRKKKKFHEPTIERMVSCSCDIQNKWIMDGKF